MLLLAALACTPAPTPLTSKELRLHTFPGYFPDELISVFEAETGVDVQITTYETNEALLADLQSRPGFYDVVVPSDYAVERLIRDGGLVPLELAKIQNYARIDPSFLHPYFDPGGTSARRPGHHNDKYSLPWLWGTTGIAYDTDLVQPPPTRWDDLWRPDLQGKVVVLDDAREMLGLALLRHGWAKNDVNPAHLAAAQADLAQLAPGVLAWDANTTEQWFQNGRASIAVSFSGNAALAMRNDPTIAYVLPEEGAGIWFDNLAVPVGAPHTDAALAFLDFALRPESGVLVTREYPYSNPNIDAIALLKTADPAAWESYRSSPATSPPPAALAGAQLVKDLGPADSARVEAIWEEIKRNAHAGELR